jgi:hypothetical protein
MKLDLRTNIRSHLLVAVLAIGSSYALAVGGTASAADPAAQTGTFDAINVEQGWVILGDQKLTLTKNMMVTTLSGGVVRLDSLAPGTRVGFTTARNPQGGHPIVTKVWVVPKESRRSR